MSDYISKKTAMQIVLNEQNRRDMLDKFKSIPSADVRENIHGELLHDDAGRKVCSNCYSRFFMAERIHFCPFCGCELFCYLVESEDKE